MRPGKVAYSCGRGARTGKAGQPPGREPWAGGSNPNGQAPIEGVRQSAIAIIAIEGVRVNASAIEGVRVNASAIEGVRVNASKLRLCRQRKNLMPAY